MDFSRKKRTYSQKDKDELLRQININLSLQPPTERKYITWRDMANATWLELKTSIEAQQRRFELDKPTKELIAILNQWFALKLEPFAEVEREELEKYAGVLIRGEIGVGKTQVLSAFYRAIKSLDLLPQQKKFLMVSAQQVVGAYAGIETRVGVNDLKSVDFLIIDDIGFEEVEINHYGTKFKPFAEVFYHRYQFSKPTVVITNLLPKSNDQSEETLLSRYGERIYDRMREVLVDFVFTGSSKRGN